MLKKIATSFTSAITGKILTISPNGELMAVEKDKCVVEILLNNPGKPWKVVERLSMPISDDTVIIKAEFLPSQESTITQIAVLCSNDKAEESIYLFTLATKPQAPPQTIETEVLRIFSFACSPDGKTMLIVSRGQSEPCEFILWDIQERKNIKKLSCEDDIWRVTFCKYSPRGDYILMTVSSRIHHGTKYSIRVLNPTTEKIFTIDSPCNIPAFSPHKNYFLTDLGNEVQIWNAYTGEQFCSYRPDIKGSLTCICSLDERYILLGNFDVSQKCSILSVLDDETGKIVGENIIVPGEISSCIFSRDRGYVFTSFANKNKKGDKISYETQAWTTTTLPSQKAPSPLIRTRVGSFYRPAPAISVQPPPIAMRESASAPIFSPSLKEDMLKTLSWAHLHSDTPLKQAFAISPDGILMISMISDTKLLLWNTKNGQFRLLPISAFKQKVLTYSFLPTREKNEFAVLMNNPSSNRNNIIHIFSIFNPEDLEKTGIHISSTISGDHQSDFLTFALEEKWITTKDSTTRQLNIKNMVTIERGYLSRGNLILWKKEAQTWKNAKTAVIDATAPMAYSPQGNYILITPVLLNSELEIKSRFFLDHKNSVKAVDFSSDEENFLICYTNPLDHVYLDLYKTKNASIVNSYSFPQFEENISSVVTCCYSPNGQYILVGVNQKNGSATLLILKPGTQENVYITVKQKTMKSCAFLSDEERPDDQLTDSQRISVLFHAPQSNSYESQVWEYNGTLYQQNSSDQEIFFEAIIKSVDTPPALVRLLPKEITNNIALSTKSSTNFITFLTDDKKIHTQTISGFNTEQFESTTTPSISKIYNFYDLLLLALDEAGQFWAKKLHLLSAEEKFEREFYEQYCSSLCTKRFKPFYIDERMRDKKINALFIFSTTLFILYQEGGFGVLFENRDKIFQFRYYHCDGKIINSVFPQNFKDDFVNPQYLLTKNSKGLLSVSLNNISENIRVVIEETRNIQIKQIISSPIFLGNSSINLFQIKYNHSLYWTDDARGHDTRLYSSLGLNISHVTTLHSRANPHTNAFHPLRRIFFLTDRFNKKMYMSDGNFLIQPTLLSTTSQEPPPKITSSFLFKDFLFGWSCEDSGIYHIMHDGIKNSIDFTLIESPVGFSEVTFNGKYVFARGTNGHLYQLKESGLPTKPFEMKKIL